mgnify:CR=1 FL=1
MYAANEELMPQWYQLMKILPIITLVSFGWPYDVVISVFGQ